MQQSSYLGDERLNSECSYRDGWRVVVCVLDAYDDDGLGGQRVVTPVTCHDNQLVHGRLLVVDDALRVTSHMTYERRAINNVPFVYNNDPTIRFHSNYKFSQSS